MSAPPLSLAAIRQPAFFYGADGRIAEANDLAEALAGRQLTGCTPAAIIGIFDVCLPDGTPLPPAEMPATRALAGEEAVDAPLVITAADGRALHILSTASPIRDGGETVGALVVWQDVSFLEAALAEQARLRIESETRGEELRMQREELQAQGEELRQQCVENDRQRHLLDAILGTIPYRVSLWSRDERLLWANEHFAAERGLARDGLIGRSYREFGDRDAVVGALVEEARSVGIHGMPVRREIRIPGPDGPAWRACTLLPFLEEGVLVITEEITERKRGAEERERLLVESEEHRGRLEAIVDSVPVGLWIADATGKMQFINDRAREIWGGDAPYAATVEGYGVYTAWWAETGERIAAEEMPVARALLGESIREVVIDFLRFDGTHGTQLVSAEPVRTADGAIIGGVAIVQDITEQRQAEMALAESEAKYRNLVELAPDAILIHRDGTIVFANPAAVELTGVDGPEDLVGRPVLGIVHPRTRNDVEWNIEADLRGEESPITTVDLVRPDGTTATVQGRGAMVSFRGRPAVQVVLRDVTREKHAEEALRESEARYRELFEAMTEGFALHEMILDAAGNPADYRFLAINPAFETMTGLEADRVVGRLISELQPDLPGWVERFGRVALTGEPDRFIDYAPPLGRWFDVYAFSPGPGRFATLVRDITAEREATEALRRHAEELEALMELVPAAIWVCHDPMCRTVTGNRLANEFMEADPGENVSADRLVSAGPAPRVFFATDGRQLAPDELPMQVATAHNVVVRNAEFEVQVPSGRRRHLLGSAVPLREADGAVRGAIAAFLDITERKEAEAALSETVEQYRQALNNPLLGYALCETVVDDAGTPLDFVYLDVNPAFEVFAGLSRDAVLNRRVTEVLASEEVAEIIQLYGTVALTGEPKTFQYPIPSLGKWFEIAAFSPEYGRFVAFFTDITERKRAETALAESEAKYRSIFDEDITGNFIADPDGRILDCNRAFARMLGFASVEEARSSSLTDTYVFPADRPNLLERLRRDGRVENDERFRRRRDGTQIHVVENIIGIFDRDGDLLRTQGYIIDDTQRYLAETTLREYAENLERSNADLERFAYVASHDLQEPLRPMVSFSQLLQRRYRGKLDADADEYFDFIVEGGTRMQSLILDLLAYSRVNTTRQDLRPTDVEDVLAAVERHLEIPLREAGAVITHDPMPVVLGDPLQIEQVFTNLVGNALKFRRPDEPLRIHLGARQADGFWEFSVQDNGIGIEKEYFDRIFVIFQRLHTKDQYPGTGIGLAIVKRIVDRHGGTIRVASTPGEGSTFSFTLPAA